MSELAVANHHRISVGRLANEHQTAQSFLDGLESGGWGTHVVIPVSDDGKYGFENNSAIETPVCGVCEKRAWGALLFPEMRILTADGISDIGDCRYLSWFAHNNPFDQATMSSELESTPDSYVPNHRTTSRLYLLKVAAACLTSGSRRLSKTTITLACVSLHAASTVAIFPGMK